MRVTWEADDIIAGRRYGKKGVSERWIIGYQLATVSSPRLWYSISLTDGMIIQGVSAEAMAEDLTKDGYLPEELLK